MNLMPTDTRMSYRIRAREARWTLPIFIAYIIQLGSAYKCTRQCEEYWRTKTICYLPCVYCNTRSQEIPWSESSIEHIQHHDSETENARIRSFLNRATAAPCKRHMGAGILFQIMYYFAIEPWRVESAHTLARRVEARQEEPMDGDFICLRVESEESNSLSMAV